MDIWLDSFAVWNDWYTRFITNWGLLRTLVNPWEEKSCPDCIKEVWATLVRRLSILSITPLVRPYITLSPVFVKELVAIFVKKFLTVSLLNTALFLENNFVAPLLNADKALSSPTDLRITPDKKSIAPKPKELITISPSDSPRYSWLIFNAAVVVRVSLIATVVALPILAAHPVAPNPYWYFVNATAPCNVFLPTALIVWPNVLFVKDDFTDLTAALVILLAAPLVAALAPAVAAVLAAVPPACAPALAPPVAIASTTVGTI